MQKKKDKKPELKSLFVSISDKNLPKKKKKICAQ